MSKNTEQNSLHEVPALVCHGREDRVVPLGAGRDLAAGLPRGAVQAIDAGHLVAAERPAVVEDAIAAFLGEQADLSL